MYSEKEIEQLNESLNKSNIKIKSNDFVIPLILFIILVVLIFNYSFNDNQYSCNHVLQNTYLYVFASLVLFHMLTMYFVKNKYVQMVESFIRQIGTFTYILLFIIVITFLIFLFHSHQTDIVASHIILFILIAVFSYLFSYIYILLKLNNLYKPVVLTLFITLILIGCLFYMKRDYMISSLKENHYILVLYIGLIVIFANLIYYMIYGYNRTHRILYSIILIMIFIYVLMYDTKKILEITPQKCRRALVDCNLNKESCDLNYYPSYPQKSFEIFHDIIILFREMAHIFLAYNNQ